jgi:hypothetical protein
MTDELDGECAESAIFNAQEIGRLGGRLPTNRVRRTQSADPHNGELQSAMGRQRASFHLRAQFCHPSQCSTISPR